MDNKVTIRLGNLQLEKLKTEASLQGKNISEYVRSIILQREKTDQKLKDLSERITSLNNLEQDVVALKYEVKELKKMLQVVGFYTLLCVAYLTVKHPNMSEKEWEEITKFRGSIREKTNELYMKLFNFDMLKELKEKGIY